MPYLTASRRIFEDCVYAQCSDCALARMAKEYFRTEHIEVSPDHAFIKFGSDWIHIETNRELALVYQLSKPFTRRRFNLIRMYYRLRLDWFLGDIKIKIVEV